MISPGMAFEQRHRARVSLCARARREHCENSSSLADDEDSAAPVPGTVSRAADPRPGRCRHRVQTSPPPAIRLSTPGARSTPPAWLTDLTTWQLPSFSRHIHASRTAFGGSCPADGCRRARRLKATDATGARVTTSATSLAWTMPSSISRLRTASSSTASHSLERTIGCSTSQSPNTTRLTWPRLLIRHGSSPSIAPPHRLSSASRCASRRAPSPAPP